MKKKDKYGNYIRAIEYLSIRAKIVHPQRKKNYKGEWIMTPGSVDYFVYHTKTKMSGPYKNCKDAENEANNMISKHLTKKDLKKS